MTSSGLRIALAHGYGIKSHLDRKLYIFQLQLGVEDSKTFGEVGAGHCRDWYPS